VETKLLPLIRGGFARTHKMKNHYVIAGWNEKGSGIIKQLHGDELEHRHIVILAPEQAKGLPRHHKLIQVVHGERAHEDCLKEVNVSAAHSVIILADSAEPAEDARTILTILAIRKICSEQGLEPVPVSAEIVDSRNVKLAQYAGGEQDGKLEVISSNDVGRSLLTQAAVHPGLFTVYSQLLEFKKNNSEIHRAPMPSSFVKKTFEHLVSETSKNRQHGVYIMPIGIQRKGKVYINPASHEVGELLKDDFVFALCDSPRDLENLSPASD
jgi:voltage-gated potassium channel